MATSNFDAAFGAGEVLARTLPDIEEKLIGAVKDFNSPALANFANRSLIQGAIIKTFRDLHEQSTFVKEIVIQLGNNSLFVQAQGPDLTFVETQTGISITGGTFDKLTFRNEKGEVVETLEGFTPIDAVNFMTVMGGDNSTAAYQLLTSLGNGGQAITGSEFDNGAVGSIGDDSADMGDGDDTVVKIGAGNLTYDGGDGSDTLSFVADFGGPHSNPLTQQLVVDLGAGTGQNPYGGTLDLTSVENVIGTNTADIITGNDDDNIIGDGITESAGDVIDAKAGDDIVLFSSLAGFIPSLTGAQIDGGADTDTLVFNYDTPGNVLDLSDQANNAGMFRDSTFSNFENFVVGDSFSTGFGDLIFVGDDNAQLLTTRAGGLDIDMRGGGDTLLVQATATADGGSGFDHLIFVPKLGVNVLDLATAANNTGVFVGSTFTNFESFEVAPDSTSGGSVASNDLALDFRGDGLANTVIGGDRNDTFRGRGGNDTLKGGIGGDLYIWAAGDGNDTIVEDGLAHVATGAIGESATDTLRLQAINSESVTLTRSGNDLLVTIAGEVVTVTDHFLGLTKGIEQIEFADVTYDRQDIIDNLTGGTPDVSPTVGAFINDNDNFEDSGIQVVDLLIGASDTDLDTLHVANVKGLVDGLTLVGDTIEIDTNNSAFQSLRQGQAPFGQGTFEITYDIVDGNGGSVGQRAQIVVKGVNDAAIIGGDTADEVTEDNFPVASGFLSISDVDVDTTFDPAMGEDKFVLQTSVATTYGTFSLLHASSGLWVYKLDSTNVAVQLLDDGQTLTDTIQVQSLDGTTANIAITINGTTETSGKLINGSVGADVIDATHTASGQFLPTDFTDTIHGFGGNDTILGLGGDDILDGGLGKDSLTGDAGADRFDFNKATESKKGALRDVITDFDRDDDLINLADIDAKTGAGDQAFKFIGKQDFHDKKGELHFVKKAGFVIVEGDVNGDGRADFQIQVEDVGALSKGDFVL